MLNNLDPATASFLASTLAEIRTDLKSINVNVQEVKEKLVEVEKELTNARISIGKLEIKNAALATIAGTITGFFGGKLGQ